MSKRVLFFDFDGVIADSFATVLSVTKSFSPTVTEESYRALFEGNLNDAVDKLKGVLPALSDFFPAYVPRMLSGEVKLFPGIKEILPSFAREYRMAVISSTTSDPIRKYLDLHGLGSHFDRVMGNDVHKSKVEKMKMYFADHGVAPADCLFVTDTLGDLREAAHAGVRAVAVTWGYHPETTLARGNPAELVREVSELPAAVARAFAAG